MFDVKEIFDNAEEARRDQYLVLGEATESLKKIPDDSVDLVLIDPPYRVSSRKKAKVKIQRWRTSWSAMDEEWDTFPTVSHYFKFSYLYLKECLRIIKPTGSIMVMGTYHGIGPVMWALQLQGSYLVDKIAWCKPNAAPCWTTRTLTQSIEDIVWARKNDAARQIFNYDLSKNGDYPEDKLKNPGKQMRNYWSIPILGGGESLQWHIVNDQVVWCSRKNCDRCAQTKEREGHAADRKDLKSHPNQKPYMLIERILKLTLPYDEETEEFSGIVVDPFAGSCTTAMAAALLPGDISSVCIDLDPRYLAVSKKRIQDMRGLPKARRELVKTA